MSDKPPIPVSIVRCPDYDPERVRVSVQQCLHPLGGMSAFVSPGQRVLLKPNLLIGKPSEAAVTTHPEIVRAVALEVMGAGGRVLLGDSPAVGSLKTVLKRSGISGVVQELGIELVPFRTPVSVPVPEGGIYRSFLLAKEALDCDVLINLPKFKTHSMMTLTLAVKNLFGAVVGAAKPGWHLQAKEQSRFADMLIDVSRALPPALNILDGVMGMEGNGPGSGDPREIGLIMASGSAIALDHAAGEIATVRQELHPVIHQARERGLEGSSPDQVEIVGPSVDEVLIRDFVLPKSASRVDFKVPDWANDRLRKSLSSFPALDSGKCTSCGDCARICPTDAITLHDKNEGGGVVDRDLCISCFCCLEVCPERAITPVSGNLLRLLRRMGVA